MAYDKHTWTCDEPITVERLNHIEDGIAAGGDCDCGFECEERIVTLTEESVTTQKGKDDNFAHGELSYSQFIDADSITVTFDGVEYECPRMAIEDGHNEYGAPYNESTNAHDWSEYPLAISSSDAGEGAFTNILLTETAGTYTVKIEAVEETITTTPCFEKARGYSCDEAVLTEETLTAILIPA